MAKTLQPIGEHILIQSLDDKKEQISGGVIIPEMAREKSQHAKIVALGRGLKAKSGQITPFEVNVGDTVLVSTYGGTEIRLAEEKFMIIRQEDILCVVG